MSAKGITLPNVAFRPYSAAELAALDDLQPSVLVFLLYGGAIDQTHAGQLAPYIVAHQPRIIYRPYAGNIPQWEPADWARECDKRIRAVGLGECIPANEINLVAEEHGFGEDWAMQIVWLQDFAAAWRKLNDRPLHLPALSPTGAWYKGLLAYKAANLDLLFDRIDAHAYGPDAATIAMAVASTLRGPCDVTEFNQVDPALLFSQLEKGIESVTWFLVGGTINQSQYDLLRQPAYYQSFKNWKEATILPNTYTSGFDISNNNGSVDWSITGLLDGYGFVSIKASEGKDFKDSYFASDWDNAAKAGLVRQAYHFARPSEASGRDEAKAFLSVVEGKLQKGDSVCLDLEDTRVGGHADLHAYAMDFLTTCENALGFKPMFYSGRWYTGPHNLEGHADLGQYGLWIASWAPIKPDITGMGWDFWAAWQYGAGPLPGINGVVDFDCFNGPIDQLKKYGKP